MNRHTEIERNIKENDLFNNKNEKRQEKSEENSKSNFQFEEINGDYESSLKSLLESFKIK